MEKKKNIEFRYYEMPPDLPVLALQGKRWITTYGRESVHFHNHLEIGYCYFGEGYLMLGENRVSFRGGSVSVIPKNFPHCTKGREYELCRWEYLFVDVEGFLNEYYKNNPVLAEHLIRRVNQRAFLLAKEENGRIAGAIQRILAEMEEKKELYKESVKGLLLHLLLEISRQNPDSTNLDRWKSQNLLRISKALDYINLHYGEEIRIEELADLCHVSETHFRRIFEESMNATPVEYLNLVRIQKACELLKETKDSVEEIRVKTGFPTASTFNRNFQKFVGTSPGRWRKDAGNELANYKVSVHKGW